MQNVVSKTVTNEEFNTLETEGKALAAEWKSICKADKKRFTQHTQTNGFDTRLGKLMVALAAEGGDRISSARLKDCGIAEIDKRRRSEAKWFVENEDECRKHMKSSKKGFTSLTALQASMKKASAEPKVDATPAEPTVDDKSNVGPTDEPTVDTAPMTASDIALEALVKAELNGITTEALLLALKDQLELLDLDRKAA